jgi:hypothetical protein
MRAPEGGDEDPKREDRANIIVLAIAVILVVLAYWAFDALQHSRRFQRCLDSGQRNCVGYVGPG